MLRIVLFTLVLTAAAVTPAMARPPIPRPEYPRPDLMRSEWQSLNGEWGFALDPEDKGINERWFEREALPQKIIVPFPPESELSGLSLKTGAKTICWYSWHFDLEPQLHWPGHRLGHVLLNFGAVDYHATVWLNGKKVGEHTGGYTPFTFNITFAVKQKQNVLVVRVFDSLDKLQAHGKQNRSGRSSGIMYTNVTGIWQSVWLERVGDPLLKSYRFTPADDLSGGRFDLTLEGVLAGAKPIIEITGPDGQPEPASAITWNGNSAIWKSANPRPWSPANPNLYDVVLSVLDASGQISDRVQSYVGIRTVKTRDGQVFLNGRPYYQKLLLDQGYFPGGIYTPADDEIMELDCEMYKRMGFNGLRKHQKIEDPRFLFWCDKNGLLVWEEMPSLGFGPGKSVTREARDRFREEWLAAINRDYNHPCIITWTIFNENWGLYEMPWKKAVRDWAFDLVKTTRQADPTRLVVDNSGGWHFDTDVFDFHHYLPTVEDSRSAYETYHLNPGDHISLAKWFLGVLQGKLLFPAFYGGVPYQGQPLIVSEYGGFGFYTTKGNKSLLDLYRDYTLAIKDYPWLQGFCYTQPYDVEQEQNGLMTFERKPKVEPAKIKEINDQLGRD